MSEKKTIQFNPDFLKLSNNKTRKKRPEGGSSDDIKVRTARPKKKDETFKKNSILRMIRKHQQEKYNQMLESFEKPKSQSKTNVVNSFDSEFEQSKQYMDKLIEENAFKKDLRNHTLKQHATVVNPSYIPPIENIISTVMPQPAPATVVNNPRYGCLKNGALPTYRNWLNSTQKNVPGGSTNTQILRASEISQKMDKVALRKEMKKKKRPKQKRIVRRTFKIGKSKVVPKVSVLISSRSIRNKVSTDGQLLKQKPMEEIKSYLIKRGLIRVGTTAPNDVLRKMYECSTMMCGELQNHNPDNLLYNFLNSEV
jgi:hypothetical protein